MGRMEIVTVSLGPIVPSLTRTAPPSDRLKAAAEVSKVSSRAPNPRLRLEDQAE